MSESFGRRCVAARRKTTNHGLLQNRFALVNRTSDSPSALSTMDRSTERTETTNEHKCTRIGCVFQPKATRRNIRSARQNRPALVNRTSDSQCADSTMDCSTERTETTNGHECTRIGCVFQPKQSIEDVLKSSANQLLACKTSLQRRRSQRSPEASRPQKWAQPTGIY